MDEQFWKERWKNNEIAFHQSDANTRLVENFAALKLEPNSRVLVPLCGKTLDIGWLLSKGFSVAGVELVQTAVDQLFTELGVAPEVTKVDDLLHYQSQNVDIFVGDIFDVSAEILGKIDAIYDRAALVALPESMRENYATHLTEITNNAAQLLICFEYDQNLMDGPPFSINEETVQKYYGSNYELKLLESGSFAGGLKGNSVIENSWLLMPK